MAKLTEEEAAKLAELQAKQEAPEEENGGGNALQRVLNVSVDLGDPDQVERAIKLGFLTPAEAEEDEGEGEEGEGEGEEGPRRRGYFGDAK